MGEAAGPQTRAREGLDHLQTAARELIEAARAMLDVVEEVVAEPESAAALGRLVGDLLRQRDGQDRARDDDGDRGDGSEIQRITVL
jgi:hypothetical protein